MTSTFPEPVTPTLTFVFRLEAGVEPPLQLGMVQGVKKRIIPVNGGTVKGPRLSGTILPGGADWQNLMEDGTGYLCARYVLRADDGTLINVVNNGIRRGSPEILARLLSGEIVDPALYYFRASPTFEVADGPHRWLGEHIFVCSGARTKDSVIVDFYQVG